MSGFWNGSITSLDQGNEFAVALVAIDGVVVSVEVASPPLTSARRWRQRTSQLTSRERCISEELTDVVLDMRLKEPLDTDKTPEYPRSVLCAAYRVLEFTIST